MGSPIAFGMNDFSGGMLVCRNDEDYTILAVNDAVCDLLGYTREELREKFGDRYLDLVDPLDRERLLREMAEQYRDEGTARSEYRVLCKNGSGKWVLDQTKFNRVNGEEICGCVLMDITEQVKLRDSLRLSLERTQIVMEQSTDAIVDWDIVEDRVTYSPEMKKKFGQLQATSAKEIFRPGGGRVHPEDIDRLMEFKRQIELGEPRSFTEVRILDRDGKYIWCRVRAALQFNEEGKPIRGLALIADIDCDRRMIEGLRHRAEHDALTGLYNKAEARSQIEAILEKGESEPGALMVVDIDNFKTVNDTYGHLFGDAALAAIAKAMKKLIRSTDVLGRIGGDEFAIYLRGVRTRSHAMEKAEQLIRLLSQLFAEEKRSIEITCSVGMAMYPSDGRDYSSLFKAADSALYHAKKAGKNRAALYDGARPAFSPGADTSALGARIDSDEQLAGNTDQIIQYALQALFDSQNLEGAIATIMRIVGERYDVSRVYIFENSEDGKTCSNTFEWCQEGIPPEKDNLQNIPYAQLANYEKNFADDGTFYCRDISELPSEQEKILRDQMIRSVLQCAIYEQGKFVGFVGFDECTGLRLWTREETAALSLISKLLSTFLLKQRMYERAQRQEVKLRGVLDNQKAFIYVVDRDTYELLYLNRLTQRLDPKARLGMSCHEAFYGRNRPCDPCPVREREGDSHEYYNPKYHVWTAAYASSIKWDERIASIITCFDITHYKENA